jgi:hypothetical protein
MTRQEKKSLIEHYAATYIMESDRGNSFGAINAKFNCCVLFYLCEKNAFDRVVAKLRKANA